MHAAGRRRHGRIGPRGPGSLPYPRYHTIADGQGDGPANCGRFFSVLDAARRMPPEARTARMAPRAAEGPASARGGRVRVPSDGRPIGGCTGRIAAQAHGAPLRGSPACQRRPAAERPTRPTRARSTPAFPLHRRIRPPSSAGVSPASRDPWLALGRAAPVAPPHGARSRAARRSREPWHHNHVSVGCDPAATVHLRHGPRGRASVRQRSGAPHATLPAPSPRTPLRTPPQGRRRSACRGVAARPRRPARTPPFLSFRFAASRARTPIDATGAAPVLRARMRGRRGSGCGPARRDRHRCPVPGGRSAGPARRKAATSGARRASPPARSTGCRDPAASLGREAGVMRASRCRTRRRGRRGRPGRYQARRSRGPHHL